MARAADAIDRLAAGLSTVAGAAASDANLHAAKWLGCAESPGPVLDFDSGVEVEDSGSPCGGDGVAGCDSPPPAAPITASAMPAAARTWGGAGMDCATGVALDPLSSRNGRRKRAGGGGGGSTPVSPQARCRGGEGGSLRLAPAGAERARSRAASLPAAEAEAGVGSPGTGEAPLAPSRAVALLLGVRSNTIAGSNNVNGRCGAASPCRSLGRSNKGRSPGLQRSDSEDSDSGEGAALLSTGPVGPAPCSGTALAVAATSAAVSPPSGQDTPPPRRRPKAMEIDWACASSGGGGSAKIGSPSATDAQDAQEMRC